MRQPHVFDPNPTKLTDVQLWGMYECCFCPWCMADTQKYLIAGPSGGFCTNYTCEKCGCLLAVAPAELQGFTHMVRPGALSMRVPADDIAWDAVQDNHLRLERKLRKTRVVQAVGVSIRTVLRDMLDMGFWALVYLAVVVIYFVLGYRLLESFGNAGLLFFFPSLILSAITIAWLGSWRGRRKRMSPKHP